MALIFNRKTPKIIKFNNYDVKKLIFNNTIVWEKNKLPNEYQQVEYIESTGTQYIDTQIYGTEKTSIDITYEYNSNATSSGILGNRIAQKQNEFLLGTSSNLIPDYLFLGYANSGISNNSQNYTNYNIPINSSIKYRIIINPGLYPNPTLTPNFNLNPKTPYKFVNINGIDYIVSNITNQKFMTFKTLDIFKIYTSQNDYSLTSAKLYNLRIYNGNELRRDFIPCYHKSDNEIGLYDLINEVFYTNLGTGTFLKGADV